MIPLIFSIASSTIILVIFKQFKKYEIDTFQAIVVNYITAATIGFVLYGSEWNSDALVQNEWMLYALLASLLFIGLFFVLAKSSQANGVASTSIAIKMSMAISLLLMIIGYSEELSVFKVAGIFLAFLGVLLVSLPIKDSQKLKRASWMLILLFFGGGMLDFTLNFVLKNKLGVLTPSLFSALGLGLAGILGLVILIIKSFRSVVRIELKNILAGVILGVPNYFSIYLLMLSYRSTGWSDSTVLAITNVSVVMCSAIIGFVIFSENVNAKKIIGLASALLAIASLYIAN